jgi:hypothetical protein
VQCGVNGVSLGEQFPAFQRTTIPELQGEAVESDGMHCVEPSGTAEKVTQCHIRSCQTSDTASHYELLNK